MDGPAVKRHRTVAMRLGRALRGIRQQLSLAAVSLLEGAEGRAAFREGRFRSSGEIHRWMYDRVSLTRLLREVGFDEPTVCRADESRIPEFDSFQLDRVDGFARKPDSLYIEAIKPSASRAVASDSTFSISSSAA
jgi:hypothetical protein